MQKLNSLGLYYNEYMDKGTPLAHIDFRKQDNPYINTKNNNTINYSKKNSKTFETQITGKFLHSDVMGNDKKEYGNSWNKVIKPKPIINPLGYKLLY